MVVSLCWTIILLLFLFLLVHLSVVLFLLPLQLLIKISLPILSQCIDNIFDVGVVKLAVILSALEVSDELRVSTLAAILSVDHHNL